MVSTETRLSTLSSWTGKQDKLELAKAGFFNYNYKDWVECFQCRGLVGEWNCKDNPLKEHEKHFVNCEYIYLQNSCHDIYKDPICVVCMEQQCQIVLLPCGHLAVCHNCVLQLKMCPLCRKTIVAILRTYTLT